MLVLDINLPGRSGLDVLHALKDEGTAMRVLVVSMYPEDQYAIRALRAGAFGYVNKGGDPALIVSAVRTVAQGRKYVTPEIAQMLVESLTTPAVENAHDKLSDREMQTLVMIASGKRLSDIAEELMLSPKTVSVYRARVLEKLGLANNSEMTVYAIRQRPGRRVTSRASPASAGRAPAHALDVGLAVGRAAAPLRIPEHPAEALHRLVLGGMARAERGGEQLERLADPGRLVDRHLLADRQVHRQVQERVAAAVAAVVARGQRPIELGQIVVMLGMLGDPVGGDRLDRRLRERRCGACARLRRKSGGRRRRRARTWPRLSARRSTGANAADESAAPRRRWLPRMRRSSPVGASRPP